MIEELEGERRRLLAVAYRMTGTIADAEDIVQETYLRWYRLPDEERGAIENPAAWLTRVAGRVALDHLGSARMRRERYVGQWLPEPVPADLFAGAGARAGAGAWTGALAGGGAATHSVTAGPAADDPLDRVTLDDSIRTALLVVLESMTPAERVAFVLHDVFDVPFDDIATIVGRSSAATRQLAASARRHVREGRTSVVPKEEHDETVRAFLEASRSGDVLTLMRVLAPGVELRSDGGGVVSAARNVVVGTDNVARFLLGIASKQPGLRYEEVQTGDGLGFRILAGDALSSIATFETAGGLITQVRLMLNPAKLTQWMP